MFDTHAHYDDESFDADRDILIRSLFSSGVEYIINPGCDLKSSINAMNIAEAYDRYYFAAGIHPENITDSSIMELEEIQKLLSHPKCVAVGEIGLDYYWSKDKLEQQKSVFRMQMEMSCDTGLPVIIHDLDAHSDCLEIINDFPQVRGVFHCFSGSVEMAKQLIKKGWYLGFDGPLTYKNAKKTVDVMAICPSDRFLFETDSPYLSPVPNRGKRNDSSNLRYIVKKAAEIRGDSYENMIEYSRKNAKALFYKIKEGSADRI